MPSKTLISFVSFNIIFLLLLIFNSGSYAQDVPKEHRGSNTMIITMEGEEDEIIKKVARNLVAFDYQIDKMDKDFFVIVTKPLLIKNVLNTYIKVTVSANKVEFQNYTSLDLQMGGINTAGYSKTDFRGQKGSANYEAASMLYKLVLNFNREINYTFK
jgi:ACT domain-containing protein